ncbi:MAG TPA: ABC transporter permease [Azospirillaceae bacterium]|nr:ABC transporter permease [Azospirillaceae bacterium]
MMARFILRRLAVGAAQLLVLAVAVFFLIRLLPADPVARFVGLNATPEAYAAAKANLGLDRPVAEQFAEYLGLAGERPGLLQGGLGTSWVTGAPVAGEISSFLPVTLELILLAFLVALLVGVPVGAWGALRPGGAADKGTLVYGLFAGSQPEFTWGILFIFVFFVGLGIAPGPLGRLSPLTEPPDAVTGFMTLDALIAGRPGVAMEALHYLALPVLTLAFVLSGPIIKMVRENMSQALRSDHVLYARAAGLTPRMVARDALRAAFAPSMTLVGVLFGFMLGGAVLVESMFSLGGLGQYAIRSILAFDYPAIQGVVLVISALSLLVYLLLDLAHARLDPRVAL